MSADPTLGHLNQLAPDTGLAAFRLVQFVRSKGIPLTITSSRRTAAQQRIQVLRGNSLTLQSKHIGGHAFDVDVHGFNRSDIPIWWFYQLGWLGEQLGLRWGGRWTGFRDYGHFEDPRAIR